MKKLVKTLTTLMLIAGMVVVCGATTSCKSNETMYQSKKKNSRVINKNYRVRGDNSHNNSTYRTY